MPQSPAPFRSPCRFCPPESSGLHRPGICRATWGVVGQDLALDVVRSIVVQVAVLHSPNDLSRWCSSRKPHRRAGTGSNGCRTPCPGGGGSEVTRLVGMTADQRRARIDELVSIVEYRQSPPDARYGSDDRSWSTILLLLDDVTRLRPEEGVAFLLQEGPRSASSPCAWRPTARASRRGGGIDRGADRRGRRGHPCDDERHGSHRRRAPDGIDEALAAEVGRALAPFFEVAPQHGGRVEGASVDSRRTHLELLGSTFRRVDAVLADGTAPRSANRLPALVG